MSGLRELITVTKSSIRDDVIPAPLMLYVIMVNVSALAAMQHESMDNIRNGLIKVVFMKSFNSLVCLCDILCLTRSVDDQTGEMVWFGS